MASADEHPLGTAYVESAYRLVYLLSRCPAVLEEDGFIGAAGGGADPLKGLDERLHRADDVRVRERRLDGGQRRRHVHRLV